MESFGSTYCDQKLGNIALRLKTNQNTITNFRNVFAAETSLQTIKKTFEFVGLKKLLSNTKELDIKFMLQENDGQKLKS